ncbi:cation:proton antiporter [Furfurilactobacillus cerevisiae]
MQLFFAIILLLLAVVPAQILFQKFDKIPVFFFQIAIGWLLSYFPLYQHFTIAPEIFLLVVISTLMFSDSRRVNLGRFARSLRSTLSLAINLVVMSILVVGTVAHLITPQLSWFGGFMLAAILSPTDAVAYQSITAGTPLPKYLDNMLQNESLLNDASGLVAFNLALSALTTGHFSLVSGIGDFIYVFIGGIILGLILGWLFMFCRRWLIIHEINTNMIIVPYIMATPYIVYFIAEELKMSGILAVVAAGILRTWEQNNWQLSTAQTQNTDFAVEGMVNSILNGTVFVIMGLNLPSIIRLANTHNVSIGTSILIGILLYLVLFGLRVFWFSSGIVPQKGNRHNKTVINGLLAGINGVHGTVTLMMALSIPLTVTGLSADLRAAIILITLTVVILSMLMPMFVTPLLLKAYPKTPIHHSEKQVI